MQPGLRNLWLLCHCWWSDNCPTIPSIPLALNLPLLFLLPPPIVSLPPFLRPPSTSLSLSLGLYRWLREADRWGARKWGEECVLDTGRGRKEERSYGREGIVVVVVGGGLRRIYSPIRIRFLSVWMCQGRRGGGGGTGTWPIVCGGQSGPKG